MLKLNLINFPALFGLFLIDWSINHVLYLNVTYEFRKNHIREGGQNKGTGALILAHAFHHVSPGCV